MGRVAAPIDEKRKQRLVVMPRRFAWMALAAMLLLGILLGGWQWRQQQLRRERQEAEVARRQFEVAMQVTGRTLVEVQERIGHAGEIHAAGRKREVE
jgi:multidrug resistance efflux pump